MEWSYFNKFETVINKYMPSSGQGETMASQLVTAVNKLIYKWYNDGDVFDNTGLLDGWCNDLSSYANWIDTHIEDVDFLDDIYECNSSEYEELLARLADMTLNEEFLTKYIKPKVDDIYRCEGKFVFVEYYDDEEDY